MFKSISPDICVQKSQLSSPFCCMEGKSLLVLQKYRQYRSVSLLLFPESLYFSWNCHLNSLSKSVIIHVHTALAFLQQRVTKEAALQHYNAGAHLCTSFEVETSPSWPSFFLLFFPLAPPVQSDT